MKLLYCSAWFTLLRNKWFTSFPCAEPFAGASGAICLSGGSLAFFSFPIPSTVAPDAWQKQVWIVPTHALHDQSIKYLSPSESQMRLWNVMAHLSVGRLPALPALATRRGASQHHLHHQDAARICCTASPRAPCDSVKALTQPERLRL